MGSGLYIIWGLESLYNVMELVAPGHGSVLFDIDVFLLSLQGTNQWFELQDLHVTELLPQMITLAEAYIQVW